MGARFALKNACDYSDERRAVRAVRAVVQAGVLLGAQGGSTRALNDAMASEALMTGWGRDKQCMDVVSRLVGKNVCKDKVRRMGSEGGRKGGGRCISARSALLLLVRQRGAAKQSDGIFVCVCVCRQVFVHVGARKYAWRHAPGVQPQPWPSTAPRAPRSGGGGGGGAGGGSGSAAGGPASGSLSPAAPAGGSPRAQSVLVSPRALAAGGAGGGLGGALLPALAPPGYQSAWGVLGATLTQQQQQQQVGLVEEAADGSETESDPR